MQPSTRPDEDAIDHFMAKHERRNEAGATGPAGYKEAKPAAVVGVRVRANEAYVNRKQLHDTAQALEFFLVHRPTATGLTTDGDGWYPAADVATHLTRALGYTVSEDDVYAASKESCLVHIQTRSGHVRPTDRNRSRGVVYPDILYLASSAGEREVFTQQDSVSYPTRSLAMHALEETAWRTAHRSTTSTPEVLYVNRQRARRGGVRFYRNKRTGLFEADHVRVQDVLNLKGDYAEQHSAGGIPVTLDENGQPRMALIQVKRRSRTTWEVAKGKLDPGETPEVAAVREVQEEMGIGVPMRIHEFVTKNRYGFYVTPSQPRLKTVHLYLLQPLKPITTAFRPAHDEGIGDVRWFSPDEACDVVRHSSLIPAIRLARDILANSPIRPIT